MSDSLYLRNALLTGYTPSLSNGAIIGQTWKMVEADEYVIPSNGTTISAADLLTNMFSNGIYDSFYYDEPNKGFVNIVGVYSAPALASIQPAIDNGTIDNLLLNYYSANISVLGSLNGTFDGTTYEQFINSGPDLEYEVVTYVDFATPVLPVGYARQFDNPPDSLVPYSLVNYSITNMPYEWENPYYDLFAKQSGVSLQLFPYDCQVDKSFLLTGRHVIPNSFNVKYLWVYDFVGSRV